MRAQLLPTYVIECWLGIVECTTFSSIDLDRPRSSQQSSSVAAIVCQFSVNEIAVYSDQNRDATKI